MDSFEEMVKYAQLGDRNAIEQLLLLYEPLIKRHSRIDGKADEDLQQFILLRILINLKFFHGRDKKR
jgi:DNA-directed RNA polymerase specialized sigma24 family protein